MSATTSTIETIHGPVEETVEQRSPGRISRTATGDRKAVEEWAYEMRSLYGWTRWGGWIGPVENLQDGQARCQCVHNRVEQRG